MTVGATPLAVVAYGGVRGDKDDGRYTRGSCA
jgi:hypothetical protein